jgi:hypothetical protein
MRTCLLCLLLCLASGACVTHAGRCQGPVQPINGPFLQPKAAHTSSSADSNVSVP